MLFHLCIAFPGPIVLHSYGLSQSFLLLSQRHSVLSGDALLRSRKGDGGGRGGGCCLSVFLRH